MPSPAQTPSAHAPESQRTTVLDESDIVLLESSFAAVAPLGTRVTARFYERLFAAHPEARPMFPADLSEQQKKLLGALGLVVSTARDPNRLEKAVTALGTSHVRYGAKPEHYDWVAEALLATLAEFAGPAWTPGIAAAWTRAYGWISERMIRAAG